LNDFVNSHLEF